MVIQTNPFKPAFYLDYGAKLRDIELELVYIIEIQD